MVKTASLFLACLLLLGTGNACYRNETVEIVYSVPKLASEECSSLVLKALGTLEGILSAKPDLVNHTLTVTYNSRLLARKNIEYAVMEAGFDIDQSAGTAAAKAQLPGSCR